MDTVELHGLRVAYQRTGSGPPVVLLHGAPGDSRVWRELQDDLSNEFSVVAWDAPGCGASDDPPERFGLADYADCLAGLVAALGLDRPAVLGHSFGGGLALGFYSRHPSIPRALVLAGAYAGWAGSLPPDEVVRRVRVGQQAADEMERGEFRPRSIPGLFSAAMSAERADELAEILAEARPHGTRVMLRAFAEADLRDVLPRVAVPTLLIYGDADERAPHAVAAALHRAIPGSRLVTLPGLGHEAYLEAPHAFDTEVRDFLRSFE
jgi:pimeloyl-ACP methyl ester carboxylesterase